MKRKLSLVLISLFLVIFTNSFIYSQGSAGDKAKYESRYIIDMPTAGVLPKGSYHIICNFMNNGGILSEIAISPFKDFLVGLSYSGSGIIGSESPVFQGIPGFQLKYRIIDESINFPALALGINTQGKGAFSPKDKRFEVISPGAYLSISKNFLNGIGEFALHGGINYSFEPPADTRSGNFYLGAEQSIGYRAAICAEYNADFYDKNKKFSNSEGILNMSVKYSVASGLTLELQFRDILESRTKTKHATRFVGFDFVSNF